MRHPYTVTRRAVALSALAWPLGLRAAPTVTVGASLPLSGPFGEVGRDVRNGILAAFEQQRASLPVQIDLQILDDAGDPAQAVSRVRQFTAAANEIALLCPFGTATVRAVLPVAGAAGLPVVGPISSSADLRLAHQANVFHVRANRWDESDAMMLALDNLGISDVGILSMADVDGAENVESLHTSLRRIELNVTGIFEIRPDFSNLPNSIDRLLASGSRAICLIGDDRLVVAATKLLVTRRPTPRLLANSDAMRASLTALGSSVVGLGFTQVMPHPWSRASRVVRDYQAAMQGIKESTYSYASMEGYVCARVLCTGIARAGVQVGRERLIRSLEAGVIDLGGFSVHYTAQQHAGSKFVELTVLDSRGRLLR